MNDELRQGGAGQGTSGEGSSGHGRIIIGLVLLAAIVRLAFSQVYTPRHYPDTADYFVQAQAIAKNVFGANIEIGKGNFPWPRPPVYPFIIACAGLNWGTVFFIQACMGIAITVLLYLIFSGMSGSKLVGIVAGAGYALNPSQLLIEFGPLSETTGTFLLLLALFFFFRIIKKSSNPGWADYLLSGVFIGIGMYCRSQFQVILGFMLLFLLWRRAGRLRKHLAGIGLFTLPVLALTVLSGDLSGKFFETGVQPIHGITMSYNVIHLLEYAPAEYAEYRDILLKYREEYRRSGGTTEENCVALALDELLQKPGMDIGKLSDELGGMTLAIARRAPLLYAKKIFANIAYFWRPTWFSRQYGIGAVLRGERLSSKVIATLYAVFHVTCMLIFILTPLDFFFSARLRKNLMYRVEVIFIYLIVLSTDLLGGIFQYGDPKYKTSLEPLIIAISLWTVIIVAGRLDRPGAGLEKVSAAP